MDLDKYSELSQSVIRDSLKIANKFSHQHVTSFHLFKAFCNNKNSSIKNLLEQSELNLTNLDQSLEGFLKNKPRVNGSDDIFLEGDLKKF